MDFQSHDLGDIFIQISGVKTCLLEVQGRNIKDTERKENIIQVGQSLASIVLFDLDLIRQLYEK
jgi:hypothetical protein